MKLSFQHKLWLWCSSGLLLFSGLAWLVLHYFFQSEGSFGVQPNIFEPWMQSLHGAAAMAFLIVLGTLLPLHARTGWVSRRNIPSALILSAVITILIISGYGLYYFGGELIRAWAHWSHVAAGLAFPLIIFAHIILGRSK